MSSDKSDDDAEFQTISKQIIDYYKRYAQNKDLLKYCLGSSVSYIPPIVTDDESDKLGDPDDEAEDPAKVSPASSVTSIKKLEWDSGADIGYGNCAANLHKSASLPTIFTDAHKKIAENTVKKHFNRKDGAVEWYNPKPDLSLSSTEIDKAKKYSSSSSSEKTNSKFLTSSSSSSAAPNRPPPSTSSSSLTYLKSKIGTPNAESTPKSSEHYFNVPIVPKTKVINLVSTKPISVECIHKKNIEELSKQIQTSFEKDESSKSAQTGDSLNGTVKKPVFPKQSIITVDYESNTSSGNTRQTKSASSSFEYYPQNIPTKNKSKSSTESSTNNPILGEVISKKQSSSLIGDVNKTIQLLEKLAKSKKYDIATKKRYTKKIVAKILQSSYRDDTTTTSPESYVPSNKNAFGHQNLSKSSSDGAESWKNGKTLSERMKEAHRGDGDHHDNLLDFAKKEREHQLDWISDEIAHLTKLKDVLQKQKTTTVYMVQSGSSTPRNYVIETDLSVSSSSSSKEGNAFTLHNGQGTTNLDIYDGANPRYVGEIKVTSTQNSTNIKIQAKRINNEIKPSTSARYDTYPKSRTEELRCWPCGMPIINKTPPDIPLEERAASLRRRITDILKNYQQTKCRCHNCCHTKKNTSSQSKEQEKKLIETGQNTCSCSNKECQTSQRCSCSDKECQTRQDNCSCSNKECQARQDKCICLDKECQSQSNNTQEKQTQERTEVTEALAQTRSKQVEDERIQTEKNCYCKESQTVSNSQTSQGSQQREKVSISCQSCCQEKQATNSCCQTEKPLVETGQVNQYDFNKQYQDKINDDQREDTTESSQFEDFDETNSTTTSTDETILSSCACCKRKNIDITHLYNLKKKLSDQQYRLCRPCYQQCLTQAYSPQQFMSPNHTCNCYTLIQTNTLNEIKKTINDLNNQESCTCSSISRRRKSLCPYCQQKLSKTSKNPNGMAYLLTFENVSEEMPKKKHKKKEKLQEIRIKIPTYKKTKDKENNRRRKDEGRQKILREYLVENRPDFVEIADERRKIVNEAKAQREEIGDQNRLEFLENYEKNPPFRLFSDQEMKHITEKNYRKLPEVQKKLVDNKRRQIKQANRVMADTFNRKLRENVLKGKRTIPINVNVVKL